MKNYIKNAFYILLAIALFAAWGCSNDDGHYKEQEIALNQLPSIARAFVGRHFNGDEPVRVVHDLTDTPADYEVYLESGTKIEFDNSGNWTDVEVPVGMSVPASIIPEAISLYLDRNYHGIGIHEISVDALGYDVELKNGLELLFDPAGTFIRIDK